MQHQLNLTTELRASSGSIERLRMQGGVARFASISSTDALLLENVQICLTNLSRSLSERVEIRVLNGEVYLRGEVVSAQEQHRLLQNLSQLPGVRDTHHRLSLPLSARVKNLGVRLQLILALLTGAACGAALAVWCRNAFAVFPTERMRHAPV
ncbi:BON domain-containing protein [Planctomicrobium piriforme]|uniref:BON domain-containing protein n=1 Tax=Planctomicrobium piriforme TaxID=1576369 RepID=A0A1I3JV53_9PLAN|nr:BON domain-containing protein [Planctomicrobium piriforme]SFI63898.1 hypothetical protein SAMN05421753_11117 [Planctomicrobium piriforme]